MKVLNKIKLQLLAIVVFIFCGFRTFFLFNNILDGFFHPVYIGIMGGILLLIVLYGFWIRDILKEQM